MVVLKKKTDTMDGFGRADKRIALVTIHLYLMLCKNMLAATNNSIQAYNGRINTLIMVFVGVSYFWVFVISEKTLKIPQKTFFITLLLLFYFLISWVFKSDLYSNIGVREQLKTFFAYCFPLFFAISTIPDIDELFYYLQKYAFIPLVFSVIGFVFSLQSQTSTISYNMSYGYSVLFVNCIYLFRYKMHHDLKSLMAFILTTVFILVSGSRGPIVYIAVAVIAAFLTTRYSTRKLLLSIVFLAIATIVIVNFDAILSWFTSFLRGFGIYSRTLNLLQLQAISADSGRTEIHKELISLINSSPIWGLGAFAGAYYVYLAHNIYLDTFACFGYVGGSIILIIVFYKTFITLKRFWNTKTADLILLLTVLAFAGGFFSDSFFEKKELWMLIGVLIASERRVEQQM